MTTEQQVTAESPVYVTKYALTNGIRVYDDGQITQSPSGITYYQTAERWATLFRIGVDAFLTREEAEADARARANKKLASLQKQIKRIQPLILSPKYRANK